MPAFQIDTYPLETYIMVFGVQGFLFLVYLLIGIRILLRNRNRISLMLAGFYLFCALGLSLNFIFLFVTDLLLYRILYLGTLYFLFIGSLQLTLFTIILYRTESAFSSRTQIFSVSFYAVFLFIAMLLLSIGADLNDTVYTFRMTLGLVLIFSIFTAIPVIYYSIKIFKTIENDVLKKRWGMFMVGITEQVVFAVGTLIHNFLREGSSSYEWAIISFILILSSSILIYFGVIRRL